MFPPIPVTEKLTFFGILLDAIYVRRPSLHEFYNVPVTAFV